MNFQHTEDRRMLADSLDRFIAEQYAFETRAPHREVARGLQPRPVARSSPSSGVIGALFREADGGFGGGGVRHRRGVRGTGPRPGRRAVARCTCWPASAIAAAGSRRAESAARRDHRRHARSPRSRTTSPRRTTSSTHVQTRAPARRRAAGCSTAHKAVVQHGEQADALRRRRPAPPARVDDEAGISLFLVPAETPGLSLRGYPTIDGGRAAELTLDGVTLGADALLGAEGAGSATIEHASAAACSRCAPKRWARWTRPRTPRSNTCAPASSSACRSAASRRCSTAWPTCCSRSSRRARP